MVTGIMPRDPRWLYRSGRSAIRQMLAASSRIRTIGGSSRPPAVSACRRPARIAMSVSAAISGDAAARDSDSRYRVSREAANAAGLNAGSGEAGGVTQAMICSSCRQAAAVRAVW